jgi:hypothetical protein
VILLFGERARAKTTPIGSRSCAVCDAEQPFSEQLESTWFCLFGLPLLPIEQFARYWRCEHCLSAYEPGELGAPSSVSLVKRISLYILLGYNQHAHAAVAQEICLKLCGFELTDSEMKNLVRDISARHVDMVDYVRSHSPFLNAIGKQQVLEAAFLATHACCELQYVDRLRINLIGNALGVGLEFVEYAIQQSRKKNNYEISRLRNLEPEV